MSSAIKEQTLLVLFVAVEHEGNWAFVESYHAALLQTGFKLIYVTDQEPKLPLPGAHVSVLDFYAPDRDARIQKLAESERVHLAVSLGDWGAFCVAELNERLSLPGYRRWQLDTLIHKDRAYRFAVENGIAMPKSAVICSKDEMIGGFETFRGPIIVKPTHGTGMEKLEDFDYEIFPSLEAFYLRLGEGGREQAFYQHNRNPTFLGAHMVQEYIAHERLIMVNLAILDSHVHMLQLGRHFYRERFVNKPYAVGAPEPVSPSLRGKIDSVIEILRSRLQLNQTFASIQFVIGENETPYPIDIHLRLGQAKGIFLHFYRPDILAQAMLGMMGQPHHIEPDRHYCLKYSFFLRPGKFSHLGFPQFDQARIKLCNMASLVKAGEIPMDPNYYDLGSYFTIRGSQASGDEESLKRDCWREADEFLKAIEVR